MRYRMYIWLAIHGRSGHFCIGWVGIVSVLAGGVQVSS